MTEMIERIATAIEDAISDTIADAVQHGGIATGPYPSDWRDAAIAVLRAMREPTEAMVNAGAVAGVDQIYHKANAWERCVDDDNRDDWRNSHKFGWQAMITAAITEAT